MQSRIATAATPTATAATPTSTKELAHLSITAVSICISYLAESEHGHEYGQSEFWWYWRRPDFMMAAIDYIKSFPLF